jgi:hypothetical protein
MAKDTTVSKYYGSLSNNAVDKINWWCDTLATDLKASKQPDFTVKQLNLKYERDGVRPRGLDRVVVNKHAFRFKFTEYS